MTAGGIAVAADPGCSSLGWPSCRDVLGRCMRLVFLVNASFLSIGCACASARATISSCRATQEAVAVAVASRAWNCRQLT